MAHHHAARFLRAPPRVGGPRRRLLERVLARAVGPTIAKLVGARPRRHRDRRRDAAGAGCGHALGRLDHRLLRGGERPRSAAPWSRSDAATRWPRRSARGCSSPARSATSSAPRSRSVPRAPSRAKTRRCSWSATRTRTPTHGSSRTRGSSPAATCVGGGTSSPRSSATPRRSGSVMPTTSCPPRPVTCLLEPKGSSSSRACKARWRPSGTGRHEACSTGSRSLTRATT